jgi:hypothetical protein
MKFFISIDISIFYDLVRAILDIWTSKSIELLVFTGEVPILNKKIDDFYKNSNICLYFYFRTCYLTTTFLLFELRSQHLLYFFNFMNL